VVFGLGDGFQEVVPRLQKICHVPSEEEPLSDSTKQSERCFEMKFVAHQSAELRGLETVNMTHARERSTQHLVFEEMWPIEARDLNSQPLPDPKMTRFPSDRVAQLDHARCPAADRAFIAFRGACNMSLNASGQIKYLFDGRVDLRL